MTLADAAKKLNSQPHRRPFRSAFGGGRGGRRERYGGPRAVLMTDARLVTPEDSAARLPPGSAVVIRGRTAQERQAVLARLRPLARRRRLLVLVSGDLLLAAQAAIGGMAVGLHLPEAMAQRGLCARERLYLRQRGAPMTVACHSRMALVRAQAQGATAAFLSPFLPTLSHPEATCLGLYRMSALVRGAGVPVVALGGVRAATVALVWRCGCEGFAAVGGW